MYHPGATCRPPVQVYGIWWFQEVWPFSSHRTDSPMHSPQVEFSAEFLTNPPPPASSQELAEGIRRDRTANSDSRPGSGPSYTDTSCKTAFHHAGWAGGRCQVSCRFPVELLVMPDPLGIRRVVSDAAAGGLVMPADSPVAFTMNAIHVALDGLPIAHGFTPAASNTGIRKMATTQKAIRATRNQSRGERGVTFKLSRQRKPGIEDRGRYSRWPRPGGHDTARGESLKASHDIRRLPPVHHNSDSPVCRWSFPQRAPGSPQARTVLESRCLPEHG